MDLPPGENVKKKHIITFFSYLKQAICPLWPQVNISFSVETAWTTVAHKDKFHFLLTFADILQIQIFIPFLIEIFKGSWKLKRSLQYLKYELRYDILSLINL